VCLIASLLTCAASLDPIETGFLTKAHAQAVPKSLDEGGTDAAMRARKNTWTVGIAGGIASGSYMTYATELANVLDDGDNLRILPMVTYGAASNLDDLLYLRGVDVAVTQSDVFDYFRSHRKIPGLEQRVNYILRLPVSEMQILARTDIKSIEDLRGKKVNFGPAGSGSSLTGSIVFQRLNISVEQVMFDNATAIQKLRSGEIAALVRVIGKPIDFFAKIPPNSGLHFVSVPFSQPLNEYYALGELTNKDYPTLIPEGQSVDTIAVPTVLAAFRWQKGSDRYRRVERFVEALFTKFDKFREPQRHPKWREVNLAATVPGWQRLPVAEEMLQQVRQKNIAETAATRGEFASFVRSKQNAIDGNLTDEQREALFKEFMQWRDKRRSSQR